MPTQTRLITADEFLAMPDDPVHLMDLVRGEIEYMSRPGGRHGQVAGEIGAVLRNHVKARKLGRCFAAETGFVTQTDPDTVRGADAVFIAAGRLALITDPDKHIRIPPDLVVEVTSPTDRPGKIRAKIAEWMAFGVRMLWQVYPKTRTVVVHRPGSEPVTLADSDSLDGGDVLPGFRCGVAELFE